MPGYDFEQSVGYWLTQATQLYHRVLSERLAPQGVTYRQMQVIGWLKLCGDLCQIELARKMLIEPPTLVRILDRMEEAGWLQRSGDPADRRRRILRLTPAAEPVWELIADAGRQLRQQAVRGLNEQEAEQILSLLRRISMNLSALPPLELTPVSETSFPTPEAAS